MPLDDMQPHFYNANQEPIDLLHFPDISLRILDPEH
jgi:hypothetical protein